MIIQATHEQADRAIMAGLYPFFEAIVKPTFDRYLLEGDSDFEGEPSGIRSLSEPEDAADD